MENGSAHVWTGGRGEAVVLLHGAWSGARLHWGPVWDELAERFLVVAPDLPGLADETAAPTRSFDDTVAWIEQLLDAIGVQSAWMVGNSFGAAVAWRIAAQAPTRCRGLVVVPWKVVQRGDGWLTASGGVAPVMVVAVKPVVQGGNAFAV